MYSFRLIFARGKHFVAAFETCSGLLKVWDIEGAVRNPTPHVTVCLPSPCWSIQTGDRLFDPDNYVQLIHSTHHDYQMILYGKNRKNNEVNIYILLSTKNQVVCS